MGSCEWKLSLSRGPEEGGRGRNPPCPGQACLQASNKGDFRLLSGSHDGTQLWAGPVPRWASISKQGSTYFHGAHCLGQGAGLGSLSQDPVGLGWGQRGISGMIVCAAGTVGPPLFPIIHGLAFDLPGPGEAGGIPCQAGGFHGQ